jgi:hypothetical protein
MPGNFWNVVLERIEKTTWTDSLRNGEVSQRVKEDRNTLQTIKEWIGHILCMNYLLTHVITGNVERRWKLTRSRGRRHKPLLGHTWERRGYWKLNGKLLHRPVWRTRFHWSYGPVLRKTDEWTMNSCEHYIACKKAELLHPIPVPRD